MTVRSLNEAFVAMGDWHLPGTAEAIQVGQVIRLGVDDVRTYPVVHGVINSGEAITILNATQMGSPLSISSGGARTPTSYFCQSVIVDGYVNYETLYTQIDCLVPGLEKWFSSQSIRRRRDTDGIAFDALTPLKEVVTVPEINAEITLENVIGGTVTRHAASINTKASFCLRSEQPRDMRWYFDQMFKLTNLLSLFAGSPMSANTITLRAETIGRQKLSVLSSGFSSPLCSLSEQWEFFIARSAMGDSYQQVIRNWFSLYPKIETACALALSVINADDLWTHVEFLSLMQSLEGLHRALFDGTYVSADEYLKVQSALIEAIAKNVAPSLRDALSARIKYGNEISLRKRVHQLVDNLSLPIRRSILGELGIVPKGWIDTRNYYTHWDEALKSEILDTRDMHFANVRLRALLRTLYLHFAGLSEDVLEAALTNNSRVTLDLKTAIAASSK